MSKTVAGGTTGFLYDGVNVVQELSGSTPTANLMTGLGIDEVLTRSDSSGTMSFMTDALGSTLALANSSGSIQTSYTYEPFGRNTVAGTASSNVFQYTGRENDGTGLYYYRTRYYSPVYQRFVSEDSIGIASDINAYRYVYSTPLNYSDPTGNGAFPWHLTETYVAARLKGYSRSAAVKLAAQTALVDWGTQGQDAASANMHAMSGRKPPNGQYQSCGQALAGTRRLVQDAADAGPSRTPNAIHAIQDAPFHRYAEWHGYLAPGMLSHLRNDLMPDAGTVGEGIENTYKYLRNPHEDPTDLVPSSFAGNPACGSGSI